MRFEWDERKDAANLARHGISFADAVAVFDGPVLRRRDDRRDYGEDRFIACGVAAGRILVVVHTVRGEERVRIIPARRAKGREREAHRRLHP